MRGDEARVWLSDLPAIVADYADNWRLTVDGPLEGGTVCAVIAVEQDGKPEVLKIHPPWLKPTASLGTTSAETEAGAFKIWDGDCAPRLLANDKRSLLLERIFPVDQPCEMTARDVANLVLHISQPKDIDVPQYFKLGIARLDEEVMSRYYRAKAQRHEEISDILLLRAASLAAFIACVEGKVHRSGWELVHGDLKDKNTLQRSDGTYAVLDPSPAFGGGLYDVALWAIDKPEGIEDRCEEVAEYLKVNVQVLGRLAMALAIPEICLASPARAEATLTAVHEITGATDLEAFFDTSYLEKDFMEERYTVIRVPGKKTEP